MFKNLIVYAVAILLTTASTLLSAETESYYQTKWCLEQSGQVETILFDRTRVDCITEQYAIEVDFAYKWAESIGQALYYASVTGKKPAVMLIVDHDEHRFVRRFHNATKGLDIFLYTVDKQRD